MGNLIECSAFPEEKARAKGNGACQMGEAAVSGSTGEEKQ